MWALEYGLIPGRPDDDAEGRAPLDCIPRSQLYRRHYFHNTDSLEMCRERLNHLEFSEVIS